MPALGLTDKRVGGWHCSTCFHYSGFVYVDAAPGTLDVNISWFLKSQGLVKFCHLVLCY